MAGSTPGPSANHLPCGSYWRNVGTVPAPPSIRVGTPLIPMIPPQVRSPRSGPSFASRKNVGKASPPDPLHPLISITLGPNAAAGGHCPKVLARAALGDNGCRLRGHTQRERGSHLAVVPDAGVWAVMSNEPA